MTPDRARRDLHWIFQHSPIVQDHTCDGAKWIGAACMAELRREYASAIDAIPDALLQPALKQRRSGRYFEALLVALIKADQRLELLAHDLQVHDGQRTIGAFDLIVRNLATHAVMHLELAFKQYLYRGGDPTQAKHWVGPRGRDRLDKKLQHMQGHQMTLGGSQSGRAALESMQIARAVPHALMAGRLFIHRDDFQLNRLPKFPKICADTPELGWWWTNNEIEDLGVSTSDWRVLPPNFAVAPLNADDWQSLSVPDWTDVSRRVADGNPCLVAEVRGGLEINRGWIVGG